MTPLQRPRGAWAWVLGGLAFLAVMALVAAGFGLGPFKDSEISHGGLIAHGDEICRDAREAFADLQASPPRTAGEAAELTGRLAVIAAEESDRLAALDGPAELRAEVDEYLSARNRGIAAIRAGQDAAERNDAEGYESSQAAAAASRRKSRVLARRIGFAVCSAPLKPEA